jgi:crotonobetainyl-CoA:carnitine CoA-transferase CaiB-like acyl-CoA transferase
VTEASLSGLRVVDLTRNLAGPYCTMLLGDLGADVIKVEAPGRGDDTRSWHPPAWQGVSATFLAGNRNKRSVGIDLNSPTGQQLVRRLVADADVLVTSFRPSSLAKRQLAYGDVSEINSRLIYCEISAYGARGPKRDLPGYDPVLQADTGIMDLTGYPGEPPARLGIGAIDLGTAMWATLGIQAALMRREKDGRGGMVEVSLYETAAWWLSYHIAGMMGSGNTPTRQGSFTPFIAPYELFVTADGDLMVSAANDQMFAALCERLAVSGLTTDERFVDNARRVQHRTELRAILQARFLEKDARTWERELQEGSVPCSRVRSVSDFVGDGQTRSLGLIEDFPHPEIPDLRLVGMPLSHNGARGEHKLPPPRLGEHTREVLDELGLSGDEVAELEQSGVVFCRSC